MSLRRQWQNDCFNFLHLTIHYTNTSIYALIKVEEIEIVMINGLTIPVSPPLMVNSKLQCFSAYPRRLINMAVNAPAAPE